MTERILRLIERDTLARFLHAFLCSTTFVLGLCSDSALASAMRGDPIGDIVIGLFGILAVLIAADTYVNDVQPSHHQLLWTSRYRHWLHVLAGVCNLSSAYVQAELAHSITVSSVNCYPFLGLAAFGLVIAWRDVQRRQGHAIWGT